MKLNYKRTILVGFAFFLISAFWQAYDAIVPLILTNHFGLSQTWSGAVMSFDNVLAVFLLPLFGALSDKVMTKYGKRTPFIFIGTILAVIAFICLTFIDNYQLTSVVSAEVTTDYSVAYEIEAEISRFAAEAANGSDTLKAIAADQSTALADLFGATTITDQYAAADALRDHAYALMSEARVTENSALVAMADGQIDLITKLFTAIQETTFAITVANVLPLVGFIALLLVVLIAMAIFRSPAVALMPDVTVKPLRSKGNAIINLMGTAGGIIVLVLGMIFATSKIYMQYSWYVVAVCSVMLTGLGIFIFTVKEKLWAEEMLADTRRLEENEPKAEEVTAETRKLSKPELISLILILASVALWYIGYNSITSKYSVYATRELGFDYNLTLIIAQAAAVVAYIPVGIISSKLGRRKTILAGIVMLASAFFIGNFITPLIPEFVMYPVFILAGIGWATINVNSFPMVVELARGGDVGKYTGYYYTASMAAQIVAPNLSGILYDVFGMRNVFFIFGTIFVALSFVTMFFVKHGDAKAERQGMLEALAGADDD